MKKTVLLLALLCAACGTSPVKPEPVVVVPEKQTVVIPPELLADCPSLTKLDQKSYTQGEVVDKIVTPWSTIQATCSKNHHALAELVKKAFNIPAELETKSPQ